MEIKRTKQEKLWWFIHNVFAHPASELLYWIGLELWGNALHDWTVPSNRRDEATP